MYKKCFLIASLILLGTGCTPKYQDVGGRTSREIYYLPANVYYGLAWLTDTRMALAYDSDLIGARDNAVAIYDLVSGEMTNIPKPDLPDYCIRGWNTGGLERLSDGSLAFMFDCITDTLVDRYVLAKWNPETGKIEELFSFDDDIFATVFSFSPHMDQFVQEDSTNISMGNQLFKISLIDGSVTHLVPNFVRAKTPSWSPQGDLLAFWGTENYPTNSKDFKDFDEIKNLVSYPWDLYAMDQNGNNIRKLLAEVETPGILKWSPSQNVLGFGGIVDGIEGIWIFNPETANLIRFFERSDLFDWSLTGLEMIVVEHEVQSENTNQKVHAYIIELPKCVFEYRCE